MKKILSDTRKPAARSARAGGLSDLQASDPGEAKTDAARLAERPQGAGGIDPAEDAPKSAKARARKRLARVIW